MQKVSESNIKKEYQRKVNECIENVQQAVENSFKNIDAKLDELLNYEFKSINIIAAQQQQESPKINSNILLNFQDDNFQQQICQELTSLIEIKIQKEVQNKKQQHQQLIKETETQWENLIKTNDSQIQSNNNSQIIQQSSTLIITQSNLKPFNYQLIPQNSIKQDQSCYAIAVNKDFTILIAGCNNQIKVFEFIQGILKQVQVLSEHGKNIHTLNFMKGSDHFISGSVDNSIIIWARNKNNQWIFQQKLNGHTGSILCLLLNKNEDIIVSGSHDYQIKFWQKSNGWLCSQTITDHTSTVYGLSFNEQQNRLISCGDDNIILVIEQLELNKQWIVIQKITVEQFGCRLCFIDNNTFTFYPYGKDYINVFEMNNSNKQYIKTKDIPVKSGNIYDNSLFPSQYIKLKCILVNKNGQNVSLIRMKQNGEFMIEESIDFGTRNLFGYMTDDGQYLITWDVKSKEIQIRKYQEK
ncbi:unnamed protein product [Paramecium primaurelia]|uniref:WD40-repeat-containing domain n=1 Tax=Paramecium primaurelia TaxID=5886 RepID=A0A8S1PPL0_PARPR|nr:unnamed protein product [Paramecium primaurelia]